MGPLHRHQLAHVAPGGWAHLVASATDTPTRDCLRLWARQGLPLVVTQQPCAAGDDAEAIAMGLSAPTRWDRRRIALRVPRRDVLFFDEFPNAPRLTPLLPAPARAAWEPLCDALCRAGTTARVYGSHGWQLISGLPHVREGSDIDLWTPVTDTAQADAVAAALAAWPVDWLRLDGELMFHGDCAVAWREWLQWRRGDVQAVLVKTLRGARLASGLGSIVGDPCVEAL